MRNTLSACLSIALVLTSTPVHAETIAAPMEVDFVLTAYYSPMPGQCCYVLGGIAADKVLNGNGTHGADGTPVYVGMLAAPPSYAFGTRVDLPGLGVLEVHDRGGAIQVLEEGKIHRLDVWAGHGEEGLARALSFGVKRIRGTIYPPGTNAPASDFTLDRIALDFDRLRPYNVVQHGLVDVAPKAGDTSLSVAFLQDHLRALGYLDGPSTRFFGPETKSALGLFQSDNGLTLDTDSLKPETAAALMAAVRVVGRDVGVPLVSEESSAKDLSAAQRLLRSMGYYKGRTNGQYSDTLRSAIFSFQFEKGLAGAADSPGAGKIGPITKAAMEKILRTSRSKTIARSILVLKRVRDALAEREILVARTLEEGHSGKSVEVVQRFLTRLGYFQGDQINGVFGPATRESIAAYQMSRGVVSNASQKGAGTIGPITLKKLQEDQIRDAFKIVRGQGWDALSTL